MKTRLSAARGVALVIVLGFVAILTVLVVAFFSRTLLNRQITGSSTAQTRVNDLSRDALRVIVGDLQQEIAAGSRPDGNPTGAAYTQNGVRIYLPKTNVSAVPATSLNANQNRTNLPNLIKQSAAGQTFFPVDTSGNNYDSTAYVPSNRASAASTGTASRNGRSISLARWNKPSLITPTSATDATPVAASGFTASTQPDWVLVTRTGAGMTSTTPGSVPTAADMASLNDPTAANGKYVVGRYAYTVYDEGGLLDINVAGNTLGNDPQNYAYNARRGRLNQVALDNLRGANSNLLIASPATLLGWRASGTGSNISSADNSGGLFDPKRGFLAVQPGDQTYLSRQDLLNYQQANPTVLDYNSLQYLGTFTRTLNAPSYFPLPTRARTSRTPSDDTLNPALVNIRWPGKRTLSDGTPVNAGDPYLYKRFPLSRLALMTHTAIASQVESDPIYKYFGLYRTDPSLPWQYGHGTAAGVIRTISDLSTDTTREQPDFFELLQAGILTGSLGKDSGLVATGGSNYVGSANDTQNYDSNPALQIVSIGANIIDQYKGDSYPTRIQFTNVVDGSLAQIAGTENLPYLTRILEQSYRYTMNEAGPPATLRPYIGGWYQPEIWNPHQPGGNAVPGPTSFRFRAIGSTKAWAEADTYGPDGSTITAKSSITGQPVLYPVDAALSPAPATPTLNSSLAFAGSSTAYAEPTALLSASQFTDDFSNAPDDKVTEAGFVGIFGGKIYAPDSRETGQNNTDPAAKTYGFSHPEYTTSNSASVAGLKGMTFMLDYYDTALGQWITYDHFKQLRNSVSNGCGTDSSKPAYLFHGITGLKRHFQLRVDPRTDRLGSADGDIGTLPAQAGTNATLRADATAGKSLDKYYPGNLNYPGGSHTFGALSDNRASSTSYADPDIITRPADGAYTTGSGTAGYPMIAGNRDSRPIMLNRPFRSVGELGYAFRDMPWKSIDFFSASSGDAGLLDLFSVDDNPLVGGRVNLNTRQIPVLQAALTSALRTENTSSGTLTIPDAKSIATALVTATTDATPATSGLGPLLNRADLVTRVAAQFASADPNDSIIKNRREAAVRALSEVGETRVWNLLIDVIAQSGRYPQNASGTGATPLASQFVVEGERRYWLHVAIDRYTGKVIDQTLEPVYE